MYAAQAYRDLDGKADSRVDGADTVIATKLGMVET